MFFGCRRRLAVLLMVPIAVLLTSCGMFKTASAPAGMGREVLDGKFAFIVSQVNASPTFGRSRAHGEFAIVSMAVRNVGTEAQFFDMAAQTLKDSAGRQYSASFMHPPFLEAVNTINPGLQVSVKLAYDVPPGVRPTQIVLHESASSHGTPVNLKHAPSPSPSPSPTVPSAG